MADDLIHIPYPFLRQTYIGIDNPEFIGDIRVLSEGIMSGLAMLANLGPDDFAIISGLEYVPDTIPFYQPGYFYLKGVFYRMPLSFVNNLWLTANVVTALQKQFNDGSQKAIYQTYNAISSPVDPGNGCPQFIGNMNQYRVGLDWLAASVVSLLATQQELGDAAFLDVGSDEGTVMAGDDPRAPYTAVQLDARYAQRINVIEKGTVPGTYIPVNPGDPTNKAYVDSVSLKRLASGRTLIGDADTGGGTAHTISLGTTLADNNYLLYFTILSANPNPNIDIFYQVTLRNPTTNSFDLFFREAQNGVQNVTVIWMALAQ